MATNLATILVELRTNTKGFNTQIDNGKKKIKDFGKKTEDVNKKVKKGQSGIQEQFRRTSQSIAAIQGPLGPVAGRITSEKVKVKYKNNLEEHHNLLRQYKDH